MKLTKQRLDELIREVIREHQHVPFKSSYEREQHLKKQREEAEDTRTRRRELYPGLEELTKLSKGIITEGELIAEPDEDGFIKIKASALKRVLTEQKIDVEKTCIQNQYYKLDTILNLLNRLNKAEKGNLNKI